MSAPETTSVATRSNQGTVAPKEALKLRLDLNLEVEIAIQAKVNGDITLSLLDRYVCKAFVFVFETKEIAEASGSRTASWSQNNVVCTPNLLVDTHIKGPAYRESFSIRNMSALETTSIATRSNQGTVAPKEALKLRLDLNLEVEIAIQAKVNGDITLSLL
ncbi:hypothetical protein IW262DRAFT_1465510 [Armillaria fumosa]|nr:hypothetical protein IW262DRAFT_1465510 [Armillaria fumosa]